MINTSALNIEHLSRIYLVANVPSYIFLHFTAEPSVRELARENTPGDLMSFVAQVAQLPARTLQEITTAYAALVALTLQNSREVQEARDKVSLQGLSWADRILEFGRLHTPNQQLEVRARNEAKVLKPTPQSSAGLSIIESL